MPAEQGQRGPETVIQGCNSITMPPVIAATLPCITSKFHLLAVTGTRPTETVTVFHPSAAAGLLKSAHMNSWRITDELDQPRGCNGVAAVAERL